MALTQNQKQDIVAEISDLLSTSKMTVVAAYQGTTVKALQSLRRDAKANGTKVKVVKNRLVIKALQANDTLKDVDTSALTGMLLYAFNAEDEVAPAQSLNDFAKANPTIQFIGAFTGEGTFIGADDVKALAGLPSKNQLIGEVVAQLLSPVHDITNALSGNLHALLDGVADAKA
ncbi:MAG: rplJ [Candidatus Saccharibacteria bacterium]|nr:rplJ [Candidatus Saccharibacteria bacterium]